jgi:hypothetical protein
VSALTDLSINSTYGTWTGISNISRIDTCKGPMEHEDETWDHEHAMQEEYPHIFEDFEISVVYVYIMQ